MKYLLLFFILVVGCHSSRTVIILTKKDEVRSPSKIAEEGFPGWEAVGWNRVSTRNDIHHRYSIVMRRKKKGPKRYYE